MTTSPTASTASITLTEAAARHIQQHLQRQEEHVAVRLGVKPTGCSGLAYHLEYVPGQQAGDQVFEQHGVTLLIAPDALPFLEGTQVDFVRQGLNASFQFTNPNERDRCGCGESFRV